VKRNEKESEFGEFSLTLIDGEETKVPHNFQAFLDRVSTKPDSLAAPNPQPDSVDPLDAFFGQWSCLGSESSLSLNADDILAVPGALPRPHKTRKGLPQCKFSRVLTSDAMIEALKRIQNEKQQKSDAKQKKSAERKERKEKKFEGKVARAKAKEQKQQERKEQTERKEKEKQEKREQKEKEKADRGARGRGGGRGRGSLRGRGAGRGRGRKQARVDSAEAAAPDLDGKDNGSVADGKEVKSAPAGAAVVVDESGRRRQRAKRKREPADDSENETEPETEESEPESEESEESEDSGDDSEEDGDRAERRAKQRELRDENLIVEPGEYVVIVLRVDRVNKRPFGLGRVESELDEEGNVGVQPFLPVNMSQLLGAYRQTSDAVQMLPARTLLWHVKADDMDRDDANPELVYLPEDVCSSLQDQYKL
jgi:hypothetical protein